MLWEEVIERSWLLIDVRAGPWQSELPYPYNWYPEKSQETIGMCMHRRKTLRGQSKNVEICEPRREASKEIKPASAMILDF